MGSNRDNITDNESNDIEYDEQRELYRNSFSAGNESVVNAILSTVATATERELLDLPTLYQTLDPDALNSMLKPDNTRVPPDNIIIEFQYAECLVTAESHGNVTVQLDSSQ